MTTNVFARLRALLPAAPVLIAKVVELHADDTSTVELPLGLGNTTIANGVAVGTRLRVRGATVPVDSNAFIRDGVIESRAPDGDAVEGVVGEVAEFPFGPPRLDLAAPIVAPAAVRTVAYSLAAAPGWTGGFPPRSYVLTTGTLPAGLSLTAATGVIAGTPTTAGTAAGLVITASDSTRRAIAAAPFSITVT